MEFHIAHEQVVKGRKKYLVPILLKGVNTSKIKDADLRMYIESHTYLNSTDKVMHPSLLPKCSVSTEEPANVTFALHRKT